MLKDGESLPAGLPSGSFYEIRKKLMNMKLKNDTYCEEYSIILIIATTTEVARRVSMYSPDQREMLSDALANVLDELDEIIE